MDTNRYQDNKGNYRPQLILLFKEGSAKSKGQVVKRAHAPDPEKTNDQFLLYLQPCTDQAN